MLMITMKKRMIETTYDTQEDEQSEVEIHVQKGRTHSNLDWKSFQDRRGSCVAARQLDWEVIICQYLGLLDS